MSTQNTSPRTSTNELAKGGIVSRRDVLKGALVGAGALAALALPTPLLDIVPGTKPKEAMAATQNVADGIYAFRWFSDKSFSLDLPNARITPETMVLHASHQGVNQLYVVTFDQKCGGYRIAPLPGHTPGMVLTATANSGETVRTASDASALNQRWTFKQNSNGSWSILSMANPELCIANGQDYPINEEYIFLHKLSTSSIRGAWLPYLLAPAVSTSTHYISDINKLYSSNIKISNLRDNHAEILSMPSGWSVEYSEAGHPILFTAGSYLSSPAKLSFKFENALDINGTAADFIVDYTILNQSYHSYDRVTLQLGYYSITGNLFDGVYITKSDKWTVKYSAYSHETGEQISLKGAWIGLCSISGSECGDPCNTRQYDDSHTNPSESCHEGVVYLQETGAAETYLVNNNELCNFVEGIYFGRTPTSTESDQPGAAGSETHAIAYMIGDDAPTFHQFCISYRSNGSDLRAWLYPTFSPLGISYPGAPEKSAKITS